MEQEKLFEEPVERSKFPDEDGHFFLNGVKVNYKFRGDYFSKVDGKPSRYPAPHFEFTTDNKKPCLITETGYHSDFMNMNINNFSSMQDLIRHEIMVLAIHDKKKKYQPFTLTFKSDFDKDWEKEFGE